MSHKEIIRERLGEALSDLNISLTSLKDELSRIQALVPDVPKIDELAGNIADAIPEPEPPKAEPLAPQAPAVNNKLLYFTAKLEYSSNQSEILKELMEYIKEYSERGLLFIVKDESGKVWNHFGFDGQSAQSWTASLTGDQLLQSLMANRSRILLDNSLPGFIPLNDNAKRCMVSPLLLKGKVAAFVYADSGADGKLDHYSIDILIRTASLVLDLMPLRQKRDPQAPALEEIPTVGAGNQAPAAPPIQAQPEEIFEDAEEVQAEEESPLERTTPSRPTEPARFIQPEPVTAALEPAEVVEESTPVAPQEVVKPSAPAPAAEEEPVPPEEQKEHEGAKRFARLLIQEIALYHPDEIEAGRSKKNLYLVLRDDIERSREAFEQRYQKPSIRKRDYFRKALVQYLADGDPEALGN